MSPSIESLQKILLLEQAKGYSDQAVMGGLDRYLNRWSSETKHDADRAKLLEHIQERNLLHPDYTSLSIKQRREWIRRMLDCLDGVNGEAHTSPKLLARTKHQAAQRVH